MKYLNGTYGLWMVAGVVMLLTAGCQTNSVKTLNGADQAKLSSLSLNKIEVELSQPTAPLELKSVLEQKLKEILPGCMKGNVPVLVRVRVDNYKEQNGAMTVLVGDHSELTGKLSLHDLAGNELGEYYLTERTGGGGLIAVASMSDAQQKLTARYAERVCSDVFGQKKPAR
ncbi:hypothetical protein [Niveispirillum sp. BGYR6]|uniref:hypothetical protein n=1 Tax=Niveispirillum sp. BGYR6 TaxID=2971249 RepID=UPI0022B9469D|nr:hypothetical protein [Niveispirillum sp. BGYR6]MDG5495688.1 hypothetical protein [Niveispirillum sp. BGYR6]